MEKLLKVKTSEEISQCIKNQDEFIEKTGYPLFVSHTGYCWSCGKNVYQNYIGRFESEGYKGKSHVIGCPHCNRTFCD